MKGKALLRQPGTREAVFDAKFPGLDRTVFTEEQRRRLRS